MAASFSDCCGNQNLVAPIDEYGTESVSVLAWIEGHHAHIVTVKCGGKRVESGA